jgi:acyl-CoA reductase-like NAD-dependent aldehyde dehydrogenase
MPTDHAAHARDADFTQTIDGQPIASRFEDVIDPSTGAAFQRSPVATPEELDQAVAAARRAQPAWEALGWDERERLLTAFADAVERERDWLATLQTMEQGMPLSSSNLFVAGLAPRIRAIAASRAVDRVLIDEPGRRVTERWHALGVVAAIAPWNGPLLLGTIKIATALIAGNTVVLKPSELTPLGTLELGRIARGILPDGVLNIIGGGGAIGSAMVAHPGFDKISFTGSTRTGLAIAQKSAEYLRPVILELGGNDAAILLPDGSVDALVTAAGQLAFGNNGQFCAAVKRVYVPTDKVEDVGHRLAEIASRHILGPGLAPGVTMGPIQNKAQFEKVCAIVEDARNAGGRVLTGGAPLERAGYFFPPTVFVGLSDGTRLVDEEQFGPVIPVIGYDDLDAVIARINAGPYGLTTSIWTENLEEGERIAARIEVGSAAINRHAAFDQAIPFPMIKQSGVGIDYADHGIKGTMRMQVITTCPALQGDAGVKGGNTRIEVRA